MPMNYESLTCHDSVSTPGVHFRLKKISLNRRLQLSRDIREIAGRLEFSQAGSSFPDKVDATVLTLEIDRIYLKWGLDSLDGLEIDGNPATPEALIECGPENLCNEIISLIRSGCGLNEEERKN
jgi:hypothetical protein